MSRIEDLETTITINQGGCTITIEKTADIIDILNSQNEDSSKIEDIFKYLFSISEFNTYIKTQMANPTEVIMQYCLDLIILDPKQMLSIKYQSHDFCIRAIDINPCTFEYIKNKTPELCKYAIMKNPLLLAHVENQTNELCMMAVLLNGLALQFVKCQTQAICIEAFKNTPYAIRYIDCIYQTKDMAECIHTRPHLFQYIAHQTPELCLIALKRNLESLKYIKNLTEEMCLFIVTHGNYLIYQHLIEKKIAEETMKKMIDVDITVFQYLSFRSPEIDLYAVKKDPSLIKFVTFGLNIDAYKYAIAQNGLLLGEIDTSQIGKRVLCCIYIEAVKQNGLAIKFCSIINDNILKEAVRNNPMALEFIHCQTPALCELAVSINGLALKYVMNKTLECSLIAVNNNGLALEFVIDKTREICEQACANKGLALQFVDKITPELCTIACMSDIRAISCVPPHFII